MNLKFKKNKGITLIALVITIVVLLILAAISINLVLGDNGIITKAKLAKNKQLQAEENEIIELAKFECLDNEGNLDGEILKALLEERLKGVQISGTTFPMKVTTSSGNIYIIGDGGEIEKDMQPGLYKYGKLQKTWQELIDEGKVKTYSINKLDGDLLVVSDDVTDLPGFYDCTELTSIIIPSSVTSISSYTFQNCPNLESIIVESGNTVYDSRNNCNAIIKTSTNELIAGCKNTVIPNGVTSIKYGAFEDSTGLTSITIPTSVKTILGNAFEGCTGLTSITIPSSVTSIANSALYNCTALESIQVESGNTVYDSRNNCNAIIKKSSKELIIGCKNTIIPSGVKKIGDYAFSNCIGLTSITIPNSVTSFGTNNVFTGCLNLESITVESGNTTFDSRDNCNAIINTSTNELVLGCKNTIIPNNIAKIGKDAFRGCADLTSITIPNSVTSIGNSAFKNCTGLTSVIMPDSLTSIGYDAFYGCTSIKSVTIPNGVKSIESYTFSQSGLTSVIIPGSVSSIKYDAFAYCPNLTNLTISNGVKTIEFSAFLGCPNIRSVSIPKSVTSIGEEAFADCNFDSITVDAENTVYDSRDNCNAIIKTSTNELILGCKNTIIPSTVTKIGDYAFTGQKQITSIRIPSSVTSIGGWVFCNCDSLTTIFVPSSVTNIHDCGFIQLPQGSIIYVENNEVASLLLSGKYYDNKATVVVDASKF